MVQTAATMNPLATDFMMEEGWILAGSGGKVVGISNNPLQENGPLTFNPEGAADPHKDPYCIMVSTEKLVFFVTGLITSHRN
jgi:hypothetical protein